MKIYKTGASQLENRSSGSYSTSLVVVVVVCAVSTDVCFYRGLEKIELQHDQKHNVFSTQLRSRKAGWSL